MANQVQPRGSDLHNGIGTAGKRKSQSSISDRTSKKIRLTDTDDSPAAHRPRRKSTKPARFSSDQDPSAPQPAPAQPQPPSASSPSGAIVIDDDDEQGAYTADFLMSYVEDSPDTAVPSKANPSKPKAKPDSNKKKARDSIPPAVADKPTTTSSSSSSTTKPSSNRKSPSSQTPSKRFSPTPHQPVGVHPHDAPAILDDEPTVINKLSHAIHALGNLNIPAPARPLIPLHQLAGAGVDSLLSAAGGIGDDDSDSDEPVPNDEIESHGQGVVDVDLRILIQNAIHLLRTSMVTKVNIQGISGKSRGRPKRDLKSAIDADRFAMSSLEAVSRSSAININCIITPQRANLLWHLYMSLLYLVTPPPPPPQHHMMPPPPPPHMMPRHHHMAPPPSQSHMSPPPHHHHMSPPPHHIHMSPPSHHHVSPPPPPHRPQDPYDVRPSGPPPPPAPQSAPPYGDAPRGPDPVRAAMAAHRDHRATDRYGPPPPHQFLLRDQQPPPRMSHTPRRESDMRVYLHDDEGRGRPSPGQSLKFVHSDVHNGHHRSLPDLPPIRHESPLRASGLARPQSLPGIGMPGGPPIPSDAAVG